ncbi:hypothetical protein ACFTXB_05060 [Streptomyces sp. NPDC057074]|uniref:hypothetical protein n=1 Tax=Streptomyces sp. NPDC057074 TaxID=3346015 RepID=UPI00363FF79E
MIVSDEVLPFLGAANGALRSIYGLVKRLDAGQSRPEETVEELSRRLDGLWDRLTDLRDEMRRDLGVTERVQGPSR